ncbi:hypothetical protein PQQ85_43925 [Paraburkholderia sediminicola]|uniref:hypothetical protein n=1 Tax=Paraburkholderia sediminicola TaxID=458836 RepID=UPI0038B9611B
MMIGGSVMGMIGEMHEMFAQHVHAAKPLEPERGYVLSLCPGKPAGRVWFDFAWPDQRIAVRIGMGQRRIYEQAVRYFAAKQGWCICFFTGEMVRCGAAIAIVIAVFADATQSHDRFPPAP